MHQKIIESMRGCNVVPLYRCTVGWLNDLLRKHDEIWLTQSIVASAVCAEQNATRLAAMVD
jgi:hypothetical protein